MYLSSDIQLGSLSCKSIHELNFIFIVQVSIGQVPQSTNTFPSNSQNKCINHAVTFVLEQAEDMQ